MVLLSGISRTVSAFITPRKPVLQQRYPSPYPPDALEQRLIDDDPISPFTKTKDWLKSPEVDGDMEDLDGDTLLGNDPPSRKRPAPSGNAETRPVKRLRSNDLYRPGEDEEVSDLEEETLLTSTPQKYGHANDKSQEDRRAMPPPPRPTHRLDDLQYVPEKEKIDCNLQNNIVRYDSIISEEELFTRKNAVRREDRSEVNPQFEYDRAFRHARAQELPADSARWAEAEKDLFYRLAMRGFEPLVASHWAMDFKTLPPSLFSTVEHEPLIVPFGEREFRAKHYLRVLFGIAANVRDRFLVGLRTEPTIKHTIRQYLSWALRDAGVHPEQRPRAIPVHAFTTRRRGEDSRAVILRMSRNLSKLARRYQEMYNIRKSIELQPSSHVATTVQSSDKPAVSVSASSPDDPHMPTLIGIMIASSVVAIVTMDARYDPTTAAAARHHRRSSISSFTNSDAESSASQLKEETGLRVIADFDFSTHDGYDVWDGLAMAITVMRIRKTMLELCALAESEGQAGKGGLWERVRVERDVAFSRDG